MCWNDVVFCPDGVVNGLTANKVVDALAGENKIFPVGLREVFRRRYSIMRDPKVFMQSCCEHPELWKQGSLHLADVGKHRDALLEMPTHPMFDGDAEWKDILKNPCVGHDLPVWMHGPKPRKGRRIMIVSQDPLRTGHGAGKLLLSTPFGFHSADYRDNDGDLLMHLALRLMENGYLLYFTDAMKIYNRKPEPKKIDKKTGKQKSPCKDCEHDEECNRRRDEIGRAKNEIQKNFKERYKQCLAEEISLFDPDVIVTFGEPAAKALLPDVFGHKKKDDSARNEKGGKRTFSNMVAPDPWRDSYEGKTSISFLHPSRTNGKALKLIGGADRFVEHCASVLDKFFNEKGARK